MNNSSTQRPQYEYGTAFDTFNNPNYTANLKASPTKYQYTSTYKPYLATERSDYQDPLIRSDYRSPYNLNNSYAVKSSSPYRASSPYRMGSSGGGAPLYDYFATKGVSNHIERLDDLARGQERDINYLLGISTSPTKTTMYNHASVPPFGEEVRSSRNTIYRDAELVPKILSHYPELKKKEIIFEKLNDEKDINDSLLNISQNLLDETRASLTKIRGANALRSRTPSRSPTPKKAPSTNFSDIRLNNVESQKKHLKDEHKIDVDRAPVSNKTSPTKKLDLSAYAGNAGGSNNPVADSQKISSTGKLYGNYGREADDPNKDIVYKNTTTTKDITQPDGTRKTTHENETIRNNPDGTKVTSITKKTTETKEEEKRPSYTGYGRYGEKAEEEKKPEEKPANNRYGTYGDKEEEKRPSYTGYGRYGEKAEEDKKVEDKKPDEKKPEEKPVNNRYGAYGEKEEEKRPSYTGNGRYGEKAEEDKKPEEKSTYNRYGTYGDKEEQKRPSYTGNKDSAQENKNPIIKEETKEEKRLSYGRYGEPEVVSKTETKEVIQEGPGGTTVSSVKKTTTVEKDENPSSYSRYKNYGEPEVVSKTVTKTEIKETTRPSYSGYGKSSEVEAKPAAKEDTKEEEKRPSFTGYGRYGEKAEEEKKPEEKSANNRYGTDGEKEEEKRPSYTGYGRYGDPAEENKTTVTKVESKPSYGGYGRYGEPEAVSKTETKEVIRDGPGGTTVTSIKKTITTSEADDYKPSSYSNYRNSTTTNNYGVPDAVQRTSVVQESKQVPGGEVITSVRKTTTTTSEENVPSYSNYRNSYTDVTPSYTGYTPQGTTSPTIFSFKIHVFDS